MNKLNNNEIVWGFLFACAFIFKISWVAFFLAPICAYLWAISGAGAPKLYRRLLVPTIMSSSCAILLGSWQPMWSIPLTFGVLSLGYGIKDDTDEGSWLGRIFKTEFNVRLIIIVLLIIANIPTWIA